ncbi:MAG: hypothetical protein RLZZ303_1920 [Candidatus Hydrogenedentota bacterium]|jgi:hypothetical protein
MSNEEAEKPTGIERAQPPTAAAKRRVFPVVDIWLYPDNVMSHFLVRKESGGYKDPYQLGSLALWVGLPLALTVGYQSVGWYSSTLVLDGQSINYGLLLFAAIYFYVYILALAFFVSLFGSKGINGKAWHATRAAVLWSYVPVLPVLFFDLLTYDVQGSSFDLSNSATSQFFVPFLMMPALLMSSTSLLERDVTYFAPLVAMGFGLWSVIIAVKMFGRLFGTGAWFCVALLIGGWFVTNLASRAVLGVFGPVIGQLYFRNPVL